MSPGAATPDDFRVHTIPLGLSTGRVYELAIFGANRHPPASDLQITLSGSIAKRSDCQPRCGDGLVAANEQCDCGDGTGPLPSGCPRPNNDATYGGCNTLCNFGPYCGDGYKDPAEQCDLGKHNGDTSLGTDGCTLGCLKPHFCGDGFVDPSLGETCDLGAANGLPGQICDINCHSAIVSSTGGAGGSTNGSGGAGTGGATVGGSTGASGCGTTNGTYTESTTFPTATNTVPYVLNAYGFGMNPTSLTQTTTGPAGLDCSVGCAKMSLTYGAGLAQYAAGAEFVQFFGTTATDVANLLNEWVVMKIAMTVTAASGATATVPVTVGLYAQDTFASFTGVDNIWSDDLGTTTALSAASGWHTVAYKVVDAHVPSWAPTRWVCASTSHDLGIVIQNNAAITAANAGTVTLYVQSVTVAP
jgi:hypothetical protein